MARERKKTGAASQPHKRSQPVTHPMPTPDEEALEEDFTPFSIIPVARAINTVRTAGRLLGNLASHGARAMGRMAGAKAADPLSKGQSPVIKPFKRKRY